MTVGKVYLVSLVSVINKLLGFVDTVRHEHLHAGLMDELQAAVLNLIRERLGREELVSRMDKSDLQIGANKLELSSHLNTNGTCFGSLISMSDWQNFDNLYSKLTSSYNSNTMSVGSRGLNVLTSLKEILLPQQRLGHDREDSPQAGGGNEVIILELCGLGTALSTEELGNLALLIDGLNGATENSDVVG